MQANTDEAARGGTGPRAWIRPLPALLATSLAILLAVPAAAGAAAERALPADSLVDSIGVNVHTSFNDTPYLARLDAVKAKLAELGVRHVRDGLEPNRPDQYRALNELAAIGVRSTLIVSDPEIDDEELGELTSILREDLGGAVEAVEGANEIDMHGDASLLPRLDDDQRRLFSAVKGDPALARLPVIGPSLVHRRNQEALGDISSLLDYGNIHPYPDGRPPEGNLSAHLARAAGNSGPKPVIATETGFHTAVGWRGEHDPVSESAMTAYIPRLYLEYFRRGIDRTFSYELLDQETGGDREDNFGLLRNDLSEKPAFAALRNLIAILSDAGAEFAPGRVNYALGGDTRDLHRLLLQKSDGTYYLALWRASEAWDPVARHDLDPPDRRVRLGFAQRVRGVAVYAPHVSAAPVAAPSPARLRGGGLALPVGERAVILRLRLGRRAAPNRVRLWVSKRSVRAGGRIAVRARLPVRASARGPRRVKIQRRPPGSRKWRTVGRGRATRTGVFARSVRLARSRNGVSKLRVVTRKARPSRAVRVRVR